MSNSKKILFSKDEVWSHGNHRFTSASRDIFDHFYLSIKDSFNQQFIENNIREILKKIQGVRHWARVYNDQISEMVLRRNPNFNPIEFVQYKKELPKDILNIDKVDNPIIYKDFNEFYNNADHGWILSKKGREICLRMYNCFMQDISLENLEKQLDFEIQEAKEWNVFLSLSLKKYIESKSKLSWHQFLSVEIEDYFID